MADLFKVAAKKKYRFNYKGLITVEDLYDLKVEELDKIYAELKAQQRNSAQESLLQSISKEDKELINKIEIIKVIVEDKLAAQEVAKKIAEKKAQNHRIMEIIADKKDAELKDKSIEELQALLAVDDVSEEE